MTEMSVSTQRLSAMIESLHDEKDDELLFMPRSANNSPPKKAEYIPSPIKQHDYLLRPPTLANEGSTASNHGTSLNGLGSPGNRESMISDYSASIHEGVPVSYIVSSAGNNFKSGPVRSTLNFISSQETVGLGISPVEEGEDSENSEEENNKTFAGDVSAPNLNPNSSLKLAVSRENTHQKAPSSIGSGNLASESGHSHNISGISGSGSSNLNGYPMSDNAQQRFMSERSPVTRIKEEAQNESEKAGSTNPENLVPQSTADVSVGNSNTSPGRALSRNSVQSSARNNGDDQSIVSSIIPPITTRVPDEQSRLKSADRAITADYKPSIPPRSKNRPKSHIFIKDSLEEIQHQLQQQLMLDDGGSVSRASTTKSGSYYSAADQANEEEFGKPDDDSYFHRPLPNIPQDNEEYKRGSLDRSGTLLVVPLEEEVLQTPPRLPNLPAMTSNNSGNENGNHDNFPPQKDATSSRQNRRSESSPKTPSGKSSSPQKSLPGKYSTPRKGKGKVKHSKNEMRSFDIDTISQLLSVTKGTLIGSEFANLGIRTEEKRALERLVDSLSRLTADMVLDPERYQEGLKRLDKATRALEGF